MSRFYYAVKVEENKAWFDDHEYRHFQVMRVEEGQRIVFTDGNGALYAGIVSFARDRTTARITEKISQIERSPSQRVAVGIAHAQWDREEVLIEKGTELGVTDFYLFPSRYSKYRDINLNKVSYTLRKAIKQSENPLLPTFEKFGRLEEALALVERYSSWGRKGDSTRMRCNSASARASRPARSENGYSDSKRLRSAVSCGPLSCRPLIEAGGPPIFLWKKHDRLRAALPGLCHLKLL